ncbi:hypothetical protein B4100_3475 [Heyndrickxia coagulans]|uniref:Uncharacterized protein n=1 Tax=Heyndrickxia coagulans TaxID=1398 RepID=A0A150K8J4_HEYCO|nr:hypothetical protein B4100_3475 [Heyndrickxia coagulans]KYC65862.1 hypothetical protein B4099_3492 [Heyndrickxia coagulans]
MHTPFLFAVLLQFLLYKYSIQILNILYDFFKKNHFSFFLPGA